MILVIIFLIVGSFMKIWLNLIFIFILLFILFFSTELNKKYLKIHE